VPGQGADADARRGPHPKRALDSNILSAMQLSDTLMKGHQLLNLVPLFVSRLREQDTGTRTAHDCVLVCGGAFIGSSAQSQLYVKIKGCSM
jgi:hypothetical protein